MSNKKPSLKYAGSLVLGISDAIVEMLGALTGLTFALQDTRLIAAAALISGFAASFSMAASEYLSIREDGRLDPAIAGSMTGVAYFTSVVILVSPFVFLDNVLKSLGLTVILALMILFFFNLFIAWEKKVSFRERFVRMVAISFGVAFLSFLVGSVVSKLIGLEGLV